MAGFVKLMARQAVAALTVGTRVRPVVGKGQAVVLRYHRVAAPGGRPVPLSVTVEEFLAQVRFLRSRCSVVAAGEIASAVAEGKPLPPRATAITFDDGYEDNFSHALPVLQGYGVPATFFVTAGWIGTAKMLWWDRLHEYIRQAAEQGAPPMDYQDLPRPVAAALAGANLGTWGGVARLESALVAALRGLDLLPEKLDELVERIAAALSVDEPEADAYRPMSWDQVRQLREAGMEIGSHTVTHARLAAVPVERAYEELAQSKKTIEKELGAPVPLVAYPAGNHDRDVIDLVNEVGYRGAFTTASGPVCPGDNPFALRRIGVWCGGYRGAFSFISPSVFGLQVSRLARGEGRQDSPQRHRGRGEEREKKGPERGDRE